MSAPAVSAPLRIWPAATSSTRALASVDSDWTNGKYSAM